MSSPRVFVSYSHDDQQHKDWVLRLSTRLVKNGVDIILDQWDLALGGDLPHFMESGLADSDRVLAICTTPYVTKADVGRGGVGYEKMILTAQLLKSITENRIVPIVRSAAQPEVVPVFLSSKRYVDFRDDSSFEMRYAELLRDIHGEQISPRPALGPNPFKAPALPLVEPQLAFSPERYVSPGLSGVVTFDYSNNNGRYVLGAGDLAFETAWSSGGNSAIHAYNDPASIRTVALASGAVHIEDIADATIYDTSSRVRTPRLGEIVIWQNSAGYYLATKVESLAARSHGSELDELVFSYRVAPSKNTSFAAAG